MGDAAHSGRLSQWLAYRPTDPLGNLAASWHSYNSTACNTPACWDSQIAAVAQQAPIIVGEIRKYDCAHGYIDSLMAWLDSHTISYLAWTWDTWDCSGGSALISTYTGTPTAFGAGVTPFQTLAVAGANFGASEAVTIYWDSPASPALATATTLADGSFASSVTAPQAPAGPHSLVAVGQISGGTASAAVTVTPAVYMFPTSGLAGSVAYLVGVGFGANETVAGLWYPGFSMLNAASSNAVGTVVVPFRVPATGPGVYYAIGYGVTSAVYAYAPFTVSALSSFGASQVIPPAPGPPPPLPAHIRLP